MITENLSTLKIHKLTQKQYDREFKAGNTDENALYLTPDEPQIVDQTYNAYSENAQSGKAVSEAIDDYHANAPIKDHVHSEYVTQEDVHEVVSQHISSLDFNGKAFEGMMLYGQNIDKSYNALASNSQNTNNIVLAIGYPELSGGNPTQMSEGKLTIDKDGNISTKGGIKVAEKDVATKEYVDAQVGDIETTLDRIIAIQNSLIGGESI